MQIHIHGLELPPAPPRLGGAVAMVGLQHGRDAAQLMPLHDRAAHWIAEAEVTLRPDASIDLRGPYVHGRPNDRFLYLTWGFVTASKIFTRVRRTKLMFDAVDEALLAEAYTTDRPLIGTLGLANPDGTPVCAAVRPPSIIWVVADCAVRIW
jgi:hypothetical protein